ncbi:CoA-binding protein [Bradyrhizobium brasilense]|uniref:acetate--CoA ligase family protein n=1 Tax=Bradyrhizobium brasilense TaxID=1419277 RepID=UPI00145671A3|nr:acetate--CoA ligase family protein [Bradyrhizobium brasilense]NLS75266.1 CoA-binding protein [Bradyrhizobium brasilense]
MNRLERLMRPRSIAVFGGKQAITVVEESVKMGFSGHLWPVHPTKDEIAGRRAYRSVAELPDAPDAAWLGVNRHLTIQLVKSLAERGAGGAVCFAAGFLEARSHDAQAEKLHAQLLAAAGEMPMIGPNCFGFINYADGAALWPDQHGGSRLAAGARGVGIVTQSSAVASCITMQRRGLPIAIVIAAGNQAQIGLSEMALALIEDDRVTAVGLHIEGFDSVVGFERAAARARQLGKPIVAIKAGRSEQARLATATHTASLSGSDAASSVFLTRLGIARVDSIPAFVEALKLLHVTGPLSGYRMSSMSYSGGHAACMADGAAERLVHFPRLDDAHRARVQSTLNPLVAVANPLDFNNFSWNDEAALTKTFDAMVSGQFDLNLLALDFPRPDRCPNVAAYWTILRAFETALKKCKAPGAVVSALPENMPEDYAAELMSRGVPPLFGIAEAMEAAQVGAFIGQAWRREPARPIDASAAGPSRLKFKTIDEADTKAQLTEAGLPVPQGRRAANAAQAVAWAESLGYPVALKALGINHKSELGAVRLNLRDAYAVIAAATDLTPLGTGLYVESMIVGGIAELIIGFARDPVLGMVMTLGTGGVLVELLRDSATLALPATRLDIESALQSLKLFPLLEGYRGRPGADTAAAVDAVLAVAEFVGNSDAEIEGLDINPLIVCTEGKGAWIADALLIVGEN